MYYRYPDRKQVTYEMHTCYSIDWWIANHNGTWFTLPNLWPYNCALLRPPKFCALVSSEDYMGSVVPNVYTWTLPLKLGSCKTDCLFLETLLYRSTNIHPCSFCAESSMVFAFWLWSLDSLNIHATLTSLTPPILQVHQPLYLLWLWVR